VIFPYRLAAEALAAAIVVGLSALWWHDHNLHEQAIGEAHEAAKVQAAVIEGQKRDAAKYAVQLKELNDANAKNAKDNAAANAAIADAHKRLSDYENRLRASAVPEATAAPADTGAQVVRFGLEDYSRFAETAVSVAENGLSDAIALRTCKADLEAIAPATPE
jgi:hypothetical protein